MHISSLAYQDALDLAGSIALRGAKNVGLQASNSLLNHEMLCRQQPGQRFYLVGTESYQEALPDSIPEEIYHLSLNQTDDWPCLDVLLWIEPIMSAILFRSLVVKKASRPRKVVVLASTSLGMKRLTEWQTSTWLSSHNPMNPRMIVRLMSESGYELHTDYSIFDLSPQACGLMARVFGKLNRTDLSDRCLAQMRAMMTGKTGLLNYPMIRVFEFVLPKE